MLEGLWNKKMLLYIGLILLVIVIVGVAYSYGTRNPNKDIIKNMVDTELANITKDKDLEMIKLNTQLAEVKKSELKWKKDYQDLVIKILKKKQEIESISPPKDIKETKKRYEDLGYTPRYNDPTR